MERIRELLNNKTTSKDISISGWVKTRRDSGKIIFFEVSDGSSVKGLQAVIEQDVTPIDETIIKEIVTGSAVTVSGTLRPSEGKNQDIELLAKEIIIVGTVDASDYPLQKKRHSFEFLREIAHLRPRTNTFGAVTRLRSHMSFAIHQFFNEKGFYYIHTPIITAGDAEGAGEMFQVTTLDLDKLAKINGDVADYKRDFFKKKAHLTVSGQLQVENFACALSSVYTFGPTFRAENSGTTRHLSEFWMIEPEVAFCDLEGDMALAEDFIKSIISSVMANCTEELEFFNQWVEKGLLDKLNTILETPFKQISYTKAIEHLQKAKVSFEFKPEWGVDLQTEHERYLTEEVIKGPVFVTDYPKKIKAFYMKANDDGKTVRAMDLLVPRLGEIIGGSQREDDYVKLKSRIEECGMNPEDYSWYLDLRRYGSVPHSGFGLGFERLIQYISGVQNIRDVIPFPRVPGHLDF